MGPVLELEIKTVASMLILDSNTLRLSIMLHNQLLEVQECSFVINFLSDLHLC